MRELRTARPMVGLRTLWRPEVRDTNLATLLLGFGMFAAWMIVPLLVQQDPRTGAGFGAPAAAVGLYLLPTAAGTFAVTPLVGRIAEASGPRSPLFLGGLAAAVSYGWMAAAHGSPVSLLLALLVEGAGIGLAFAAVAVRTVRSVPADQAGVAAGVNTIMRTVGGTLGTNLAGTGRLHDLFRRLRRVAARGRDHRLAVRISSAGAGRAVGR
ncbi:MFS transporter [Actinoplanes subtropicus]|uniref:MFS transporter n=1 Tax=Actinoplanes subtropicus TaxID=543632 RepID=UPI000AB6CB3C|nr:MFS transporter [Actinoplanes subtropicus]